MKLLKLGIPVLLWTVACTKAAPAPVAPLDSSADLPGLSAIDAPHDGPDVMDDAGVDGLNPSKSDGIAPGAADALETGPGDGDAVGDGQADADIAEALANDSSAKDGEGSDAPQADDLAVDSASTDVGDAADATKLPCAAPPAPTGLPVPGAPCAKQGELRCTAEGSFSAWILYGQATGGAPTCVLPNRVECGNGPGGALTWQLLPCPPLGPGCDSKAVGTVVHAMCQDLPGGAVCGPTAISGKSGAMTWMCPDSLQGKLLCGIKGGESNAMNTCAPFDAPTLGPVAATFKAEFQKAAGCAGKAVYWFPHMNCTGVNICGCLGQSPEVCSPQWVSAQACSMNLPGKQGVATCASTCEEMKHTAKWGPKFLP